MDAPIQTIDAVEVNSVLSRPRAVLLAVILATIKPVISILALIGDFVDERTPVWVLLTATAIYIPTLWFPYKLWRGDVVARNGFIAFIALEMFFLLYAFGSVMPFYTKFRLYIEVPFAFIVFRWLLLTDSRAWFKQQTLGLSEARHGLV
jgi:hypothetical protein